MGSVVKYGLELADAVWNHHRLIMKIYHHVIPHKVLADDFIRWAEAHPDHPKNQKKKADVAKSYDAAN